MWERQQGLHPLSRICTTEPKPKSMNKRKIRFSRLPSTGSKLVNSCCMLTKMGQILVACTGTSAKEADAVLTDTSAPGMPCSEDTRFFLYYGC
jgi:hypothetical protein